MRRSASLLLLCVTLVVGASAPIARGSAHDWVNAVRAANGLPADVRLDPEWSARCTAHIRYMRQTNTVTHSENSRSPWFTPEGDWAARRSILASGPPWTADRFIWENAPLHMAQVLAPQLAVTGIANDGQFACMTTLPGYTRPLPSTTGVLTYPGNATRARERAFTEEYPQTPAQALGLSNPTGPQLYVFQWGPATASGLDARGAEVGIAAATLIGPQGRIPVRWIDRRHAALGRFLPLASGIIVPVRPLQADSTYVATVRFTNDVDHAWSFVTDGPSGTTAFGDLRALTRRVASRRVCVRRSAGRCVQYRVRHTHNLRVRGRLFVPATGRAAPRTLVGVAFRGVEQPLLRTGVDGTFDVRYQVQSWQRRYALNVTVNSPDAIPRTTRARFR